MRYPNIEPSPPADMMKREFNCHESPRVACPMGRDRAAKESLEKRLRSAKYRDRIQRIAISCSHAEERWL